MPRSTPGEDRETQAFYGTPPPRRHGESLNPRDLEFDLPPFSAVRVAATDAEHEAHRAG
jgi:hypothetical protein